MDNFEAVVVGSGLAGLTAALSLAPRKTLLLTKTAALEGGSTPWAQGGIAFPQGEGDIPLHIQDTLLSGAGKSWEPAVEVLVRQAPEALGWLESLGLLFDRNDQGYLLGKEGAHSVRRILHLGGDATGRQISSFLARRVLESPHITVWTDTLVCSLEKTAGAQGDRVTGLWVLHSQTGLQFIPASTVVLAGGGVGQLFSMTTNPPESTGDALALALRAGLSLQDMEMIQFHPTALKVRQEGPRPQLPLLSEALRGEGAKLVTVDQGQIQPLPIAHPLAELGPRDIVARSIFQKIQQGGTVGLDARNIPDFSTHFPTVWEICRRENLDPSGAILPVVPAVHYTMGGIPTDTRGRTALQGLWAVGECARTGVHGANRLASNSLLECLVFARQAVSDIITTLKNGAIPPPVDHRRVEDLPAFSWNASLLPSRSEIQSLEKELQNLMFEAAGPVRDSRTLTLGLEHLTSLEDLWHRKTPNSQSLVDNPDFVLRKDVFELENLFLLGKEVLSQALANPVSSGAHFRQDSL